MRCAGLSAALFLVACGGPRFEAAESWACPGVTEASLHPLTQHLLASQDGSGDFHYASDDPLVDVVQGRYDLSTGDFEWTESHPDGHFRERTQVAGFGIAWPNGDADLTYGRVTHFIGGTSETTRVRYTQRRCDVSEVVREANGRVRSVTEGTLGPDGLQYRREEVREDLIATGEGRLRPDGQRTHELAWVGEGLAGTHALREEPNGRVELDFDEVKDRVRSHGRRVTRVDGSTRWVYQQDVDRTQQFWEYTLDFFGNGEGRFELVEDGARIACDVRFEDAVCTLYCPERDPIDC